MNMCKSYVVHDSVSILASGVGTSAILVVFGYRPYSLHRAVKCTWFS